MPYVDPDAMGPVIDEVLAGTDALLFGRRTWQVMAGAWPSGAGDPFADRVNELPKHVASRTLNEADMTWNSQLLPADDVVGAVARLWDQDGGALQLMGARAWPAP
jgi:dihydrofolate reductase